MRVNLQMILAATCLFANAMLCAQHTVLQINTPNDAVKGGGGYKLSWSGERGRLVLYRDSNSQAHPIICMVNGDSSCTIVNPFNDLDGLSNLTVWDVAPTPSGGVVVSATATFSGGSNGNKVLRDYLFTYDQHGKLIASWNTRPYLSLHLTVDGSGNIFTLDLGGDGDIHPLISEYSPDGRVIREFLSSAEFTLGDKVLTGDGFLGESEVFVRGGDVFVWLPKSEEMLHYTEDGNLISKTLVGPALRQIAANKGKAKVLFASADSHGSPTLQVALISGHEAVNFAMVYVAADGATAHTDANGWENQLRGKFLGPSGGGANIFFENVPGSSRATLVEEEAAQ